MNFTSNRSSGLFSTTQDVYDFYDQERNRSNSLKKGLRLSTMSMIGLGRNDNTDQNEQQTETLSEKGFRISRRLHFPSRKKKAHRSNSFSINTTDLKDETLRLVGVLCYFGKTKGISGSLSVNSKKISFVSDLAEHHSISTNSKSPVIRLRRHPNGPLYENINNWEIDFFNLGEISREISGDYHVIFINCRNFRQFKIGLQQVPADRLYDRLNRIGLETMNSVQKRCFLWEYLYFTYQYRIRSDWHKHELWYINNFKIQFSQFNEIGSCPTLPEVVIVPRRVTDQELNNIAAISDGQRVPVVSYLHRETGHLIIRSSNIPRQSLYDTFPAFQELKITIEEYQIDTLLPSVEEVEKCYFKLRRACFKAVKMNGNGDIDSRFNIEHSKHFWSKCGLWLHLLSKLLRQTKQMTAVIKNRATVGLVERYDCNWNCILSSLIQLFVDPQRRTIAGFESLLSKEWVYLSGYRQEFGTKLAFRKPNSIMFLLFLDAVHQLMIQNERCFEFSAFYLMLLVDAELSSEMFSGQQNQRSQFEIDKTHLLIYNPLFVLEDQNTIPLTAKTHVANLRLFTKLFYRSIPWKSNLDRFTTPELMFIERINNVNDDDDDNATDNHNYHDHGDDV